MLFEIEDGTEITVKQDERTTNWLVVSKNTDKVDTISREVGHLVLSLV